MRFLRALLVLKTLLCAIPSAQSADSPGTKIASYGSYIAELQKDEDGGVFVASCELANGNRGVLIFPLAQKAGKFFELHNGNTSVSSGEVTIVNGAYKMEVDGPADDVERGKRVLKTLVMGIATG